MIEYENYSNKHSLNIQINLREGRIAQWLERALKVSVSHKQFWGHLVHARSSWER